MFYKIEEQQHLFEAIYLSIVQQVDGRKIKKQCLVTLLKLLTFKLVALRQDGCKRIADNALVALTLMIAESIAEEKGLIINVVVHLINKLN